MQVSLITIITILMEIILAAGIPILTYMYFRKKTHIPFKPVLVGMLIWCITTQIVEKGIHFIIINFTTITHMHWLFALYAALMAGVFEETGRLIAFRKLLKQQRQWKDGLAYGIGHGGIEAILIGAITGMQLLAFSLIINAGNITSLKNFLPHLQFIHLVNTLYNPPTIFLLGGIERICAFAMQLLLSILMLLAVKEKRKILYLYAVLLHALFDLPTALYQTKQQNLWMTELCIIIFGIGSIVWVIKSKKFFV